MNYKEFENKLRDQRKAAVPEMPQFFETEKSERKNFLKIAIPAAALVLCCAIGLSAMHFAPKIFGGETPIVPQKEIPQAALPTDVLTDGVISGDITPNWYGGKPLKIKTLSAQSLNLEEGEQLVAAPNLKYLEVRKIDDFGSWDPSYKYIDVEKGEVIEVADLVKPILMEAGAIEADTWFHVDDYNQNGLALTKFTDGIGNGGSFEYIVDTVNKTCKKIEISGREAETRMTTGRFNADGTQLFLIIESPMMSDNRYDKPYCYDVRTGASVDLDVKLKALDGGDALSLGYYWTLPFREIRDAGYDKDFSPTGKYLVLSFHESGKSVHSAVEIKMFYNVETRQATLIEGLVDHYTANDEYAIISTENGGYKLKCETGEMIKMTAENTDISDYIRVCDVGNVVGSSGDSRLFYHNLINGQTREVVDAFEYGYTFSSDHKYLYYYVLGSDNVICVELATWKSFAVPVDADFKAAQQAITDEKWLVQFTMLLDETKNELTIGFMPDVPRYEPEKMPEGWMENWAKNPIFRFTGDSTTPDIAMNMKDALYLNDFLLMFQRYLTFSVGEGFLICTVDYEGQSILIVEDSRDNTLSYYEKIDGAYKVIYVKEAISDVEGFKQTLINRGLEVKPAAMDYNRVLSRDLGNSLESELYYRDKTAFMKTVHATYVMDTKDEGTTEFEITDTAKIEQIYDFVMSKNPKYAPTAHAYERIDEYTDKFFIGFVKKLEMSKHSEDYPDVYHRYMPGLSCFVLDGKYNLTFGSLEAELSKEDYETLKGYYNDILTNGTRLTEGNMY